MNEQDFQGNAGQWARLRFSVIGGLLAGLPAHGQLRPAIEELAARQWRHPTEEGKLVRFGASTIEAWYYRARSARDPVAALSRRIRRDAGRNRVLVPELVLMLESQYQRHPDWSYQLHYDNLKVVIKDRVDGSPPPSYATLKRCMKSHGWRPRPTPRSQSPLNGERERPSGSGHEVRSFEVSFVHGLWHLDFHHGRRQVLDERGRWARPKALCILDDYTRLCCHLQWYLEETTPTLIHGLTQAFFKRGLPRALMTDNGAAMLAHEFRNGLSRLGIAHELTLPYSPHQNGKQESFWGHLEGRLMKMLTAVPDLTLERLNEFTQAWVEREYQRSSHAELGMSPLDRLIKGPAVDRPTPSRDVLKLAFSVQHERRQRRSDGTITIRGIRFEVPARFHHLEKISVRYQSWDLSSAVIVDPQSGTVLGKIIPLDKTAHGSGRRRPTPASDTSSPEPSPVTGEEAIPPLLRQYMAEYAATGLPFAYLPGPPSGTPPSSPAKDVAHD